MRELRLWVALARCISGRHDGRSSDAFGYHRGLGAVIGTVVVLLAVEGAVTELVLAIMVPHTAWPWVALGLHLYGLGWLAGLHAAHVTRPHLLTGDTLIVRDGVFAEKEIALRDVLGIRPTRVSGVGRSGYRVTDGVARSTHGDATVALDLDCDPATLLITVDEPLRFVERLRAVTAAARTPGSAPPR